MTTVLRLTAAMACALTVLLAAIPAHAHDEEKGPNGGPMVTVEDKHLEFVAKGVEIIVYVSDKKHDPIAMAGGSGRAIVQASGKTTTVALTPGDGNRLVGKAEAAVASGARVVVSATLPGGAAVQARFTVN